MSNIILSNSNKALLISRNPSRFHVNFVLSCSIRSRGIRSAAINLSTSCSVSIPVANPPIRMTHHSSKKILIGSLFIYLPLTRSERPLWDSENTRKISGGSTDSECPIRSTNIQCGDEVTSTLNEVSLYIGVKSINVKHYHSVLLTSEWHQKRYLLLHYFISEYPDRYHYGEY